MHGHDPWRHAPRQPIRPVRGQQGPWGPRPHPLAAHAARQQAMRDARRAARRRSMRMARRAPMPLILFGGAGLLIAGVTVVSLIFTVLFFVAATVVPVLLVAGGVKLAVSHSRRRAALAGHGGPMLAGGRGPHAARPQLDPLPHARARFAQLRHEYAAFECDALAVLRLPALADVSVPSTARFVDAFAEAQALDAEGPLPPEHRARFVAAVEHAWQAWRAARDAAERIRTSHLPAEERSTVERVVRLLTIARDTESDAERLVAYGKARSELAKLERTGSTLRIPQPAQAQLDNAYRGQLPA